jgi:hypothetical protein
MGHTSSVPWIGQRQRQLWLDSTRDQQTRETYSVSSMKGLLRILTW